MVSVSVQCPENHLFLESRRRYRLIMLSHRRVAEDKPHAADTYHHGHWRNSLQGNKTTRGGKNELSKNRATVKEMSVSVTGAANYIGGRRDSLSARRLCGSDVTKR